MIRESLGRRIYLWINAVVLLLVAALCLVPILHVIALSFSKSSSVMAGHVTLFPVNATLSSYKLLMQRPDFFASFRVSLLRVLLGLETADSGTVTGVKTPAAVFQEDRLCPQLTAAVNLTLTGHGLSPQEAERELRGLGFTDAELALPAARLSGGQKRRAALLRALLCKDAATLLLDEPFTGMDAELVADAVAATKRLAGARPTILVTHDRTAADLLGWPVKEV